MKNQAVRASHHYSREEKKTNKKVKQTSQSLSKKLLQLELLQLLTLDLVLELLLLQLLLVKNLKLFNSWLGAEDEE